MKLETIEDFERKANALENPDSSPEDFLVKEFGYCTVCDQITDCHSWHTGSEGITGVDCLRCMRTFGGLQGPNEKPRSQYMQGDDVPQRFKADLLRVCSREYQKAQFIFELKIFIAIKKKEAKDAKSLARVAGKAVSKGNEVLARFV